MNTNNNLVTWQQLAPEAEPPSHPLGEVAFTSFVMRQRTLPHWQWNVERLYHSMQYLQATPLRLSLQEFEMQLWQFLITSSWPLQDADAAFYVRLSLVPVTPHHGVGAPVSGWRGFLQWRRHHYTSAFSPVSLATVDRVRLTLDARCKISQYAAEAVDRRRHADCHDVVYLNDRGELLESSTSNILIYTQGHFTVAPLAQLQLEGIAQRSLLGQLPQAGKSIAPRLHHWPSMKANIQAYQLWLTNQVSGAVPVASIDGHQLAVDEAQTQWLNSQLQDSARHSGRRLA